MRSRHRQSRTSVNFFRLASLAVTLLVLTCSSVHQSFRSLLDAKTVSTSYSSSQPHVLRSQQGTYQNYVQTPAGLNVTCGGIWKLLLPEVPLTSPRSVAAVLSFCTGELDWLHDELTGKMVLLRELTIYSKCGRRDVAEQFLTEFRGARVSAVIELPNVGRVDHTFAYHMANLPVNSDPQEVIIFLKDTFFNVHQRGLTPVPVHVFIKHAASPFGFGCGLDTEESLVLQSPTTHDLSRTRVLKFIWGRRVGELDGKNCVKRKPTSASDMTLAQRTSWHITSEVEKFTLASYERNMHKYGRADDASFFSHSSFSEWLTSNGIRLPEPVTPVCYGGSFAVKTANVLNARQAASKMLRSLSRGDNILEGHFAERTWAGLLSSALPRNILHEIDLLSLGTVPQPEMRGMLCGCSQK